MADLLAVALHSGAHPDVWEQIHPELAAPEANECYVPPAPRPPSELAPIAPDYRPPAR